MKLIATLRSLPIIGRAVPTETGFEAAERFVSLVAEAAQQDRVVRFYRLPRRNTDLGGWEWMANEDWRNEVLRYLESKGVQVKDAHFVPPDPMGDWEFIAMSTVAVPYVATLTLADAMEAK